MRIAVILLLLACGKSDKATKDSPAPPPGAFAKLQVTIDGAPFAADRALVKRTSPDVFTILVGAGKGSCETLLAGTEDSAPGKSFAFTVTKRLAATGHENFQITELWSRDFVTKPALPAKVKLEGTGDKGTNVTVEIPPLGDKALSISGSLVATSCGDPPPPSGMGVPKVPHKMKSSIIVSGKALKIAGATVAVRKGGSGAADLPNVWISTGPKDCSGVTLPAQIMLERVDGKWTLKGTWFEQPIAGDEAATKELTFSANDTGQSADGPVLVLQLSGAGKFGDYKVEITGTAEAIECVN